MYRDSEKSEELEKLMQKIDEERPSFLSPGDDYYDFSLLIDQLISLWENENIIIVHE